MPGMPIRRARREALGVPPKGTGVKQLRVERDILSKAAAWFARETGTLPSGSSGS
jgi:hypothetical protein